MTRIKTWSRIEPDTRAPDPRRGARVVTADPLWLLGRQWWVGELEGRDGGTPIRAEIDVRVDPVAAVDRGGERRSWDRERNPLDAALAEPEAVDPATPRIALDRGRLLLRLLDNAIAGGDLDADDGRRLRRTLTRRFPATHDSPAARRRSATSSGGDELLDGTAVLADVRSADDPVLAAAPIVLDRWLSVLGVDPEELDETTEQDADPFDSARRSHAVTLHGAGGTRAHAADVLGPALRWDDLELRDVGGAVETRAAVPSRTAFDGQPPLRWWTRAETATDWVTAPAGPTDLPRLVVTAAFVEQGVDWWLVPLWVETDAFVRVTEVRLFDAFGEAVTARPADDPSLRLWESGAGAGAAACLARVPSLAGDAIEDTEFRPDDLRNLVWAIERIAPDADGRGFRRATGAEPRDVPEARIVLRTPTPPGWIPYRRIPGSDEMVQVPLTSAEGLRTPLGVLARDRLGMRREHLPSRGVAVKRVRRLARSHGGCRRVWIARTASDAQMTGGPGLLHDVIERPEV